MAWPRRLRARVVVGALSLVVVGVYLLQMYDRVFRTRLEAVQDLAMELRDRVARPEEAACPFLFAQAIADRRRGIAEAAPQLLSPRVAVVTMAIGQQDEETGNMVVANKRAYCERHGYTLEVERGKRVDPSRPIAWTKIILLQHFLKTYDVVVWMDGDAVVANSSVRLEDMLDADHDVYLAADDNNLNTGVVMVRKSPWTDWFLETVWDQTWLVTGHHPFAYEQRAFHYLYATPFFVMHVKTHYKDKQPVYERFKEVRAHLKVVPSCAFNSYRCWDGCANPYYRGHFIMHFAGEPEPARSFKIRNFLKFRGAT